MQRDLPVKESRRLIFALFLYSNLPHTISKKKINMLKIFYAKAYKSGFVLLVEFADGVKKRYDCYKLLGIATFKPLEDVSLFNQARVDSGGHGDEIDVSEAELWENGYEV